MTGTWVAASTAPQSVDVGTFEGAVPADLGDDERRHARVLELRASDRAPSRPEPCSHPRTTISPSRSSRPTAIGRVLRQPVHQAPAARAPRCRARRGPPPPRTAPRPQPRRARRHPSAPARRPPRRWRAITARFTGSPVRAASRSTTWIHGAPAAAKRDGLLDRIVVIHGLAVVVALVEANAAPAQHVDGRIKIHERDQAGGRDRADEVVEDLQADRHRTSPGGTAWPSRCRAATAATTLPP